MQKSRILTVDDDPNISALVKLFLEKTGRYEVREVNRSTDALGVARSFRPDLILLDVDMPGKDGGDVAREIAREPALHRVPFIFFTSLISGEEAGGGYVNRNGTRYLAKPVNPVVLTRAVDRVLAEEAASVAMS